MNSIEILPSRRVFVHPSDPLNELEYSTQCFPSHNTIICKYSKELDSHNIAHQSRRTKHRCEKRRKLACRLLQTCCAQTVD